MLKIGDVFGGGIVFYVDETGENGLVVSDKDYQYSSNIPYAAHWSLGINPKITGAVGQLIGDGKNNHVKILNAYGSTDYISSFLSTLVIDGVDGWCLPSKQELQLLLAYSALLPNMSNYVRPSSTEVDGLNIAIIDFSPRHSDPILIGKKYGFTQIGYLVRPIRMFGSFEPFEIDTLTLPQKPTSSIQLDGEPNEKSIQFKADFKSIGSAPITNKGIIWNKIGNPYFGNLSESKTSLNLELGEEIITATDLLSGVKYYFSSYATNKYGTSYSLPVEVSTAGDKQLILLTTKSAVNVTNSSVTLNGNSRMIASHSILELGFEIGSDSTFADSKKYTLMGDLGDFSKEITGLEQYKLYYYQVYAIVKSLDGDEVVTTQYGGIATFTTLKGENIPEFETPEQFSISALVNRFELYATNLKDIRHKTGSRRDKAFMHLDIQNLQEALTNGVKFPALFLQTPDVEKSSVYDNISEQQDFTYVIVLQLSSTKALLIDEAKNISDKIYNRLMIDAQAGVLPGITPGTSEGIFGPIGDGLYGWAKSCGINSAYNGEVNNNDWEDLA